MRHTWTRAAAAALALACAALGAPWDAAARPYTVEDLLAQEQVLQQAVDPTGRWWVFERTDPFATAPRFDLDLSTPLSLSRLYRVDLAHPAAARPLIAPDPGAGQVLVGFSPSGARLAICRFSRGRWTLGVVTLRTRAVRWFQVTPERSAFGRALQWLDDRRLLVIDRPDGTPSFPLRQGHASADALPRMWAAQARGRAAVTASFSGRHLAERPRPPPRRLLRLDVATGASRTLAQGELTDLELSPDHRRVALLEAGEDIQPRADGPSQGDLGTSSPASHLSLLDLESGAEREPCRGCDVLPTLLAWSPSGRALLVFARQAGEGWSAGRLLRIDAGGAATPLASGLRAELSYRPEVVRAGWMAEDPVLLARAPRALRADWFRLAPTGPRNLTAALPPMRPDLVGLDPAGMTLVASGGLWRVDAEGRTRRLAAEDPVPIHTPRAAVGRADLTPPAGAWVALGPPGRRTLARVDAAGLRPELALPEGGGTVIAAGPGPAAVLHAADAHRVETILAVRPRRAPIAVARLDARLADVDPETVLPVRHAGPEGQSLTSWLFLPPRPPGARPPPLVVLAYAGARYAQPPQALAGPVGFTTEERMLLGHGYAVLTPSLPTPAATGEDMPGLADRILAVVDAASAAPQTTGRFDAQRLALWGHSYGAFTVMAAVGQTDRFAAGVAISGFSDQTAIWSALPVAHRVLPEEGSWSNWMTGNTESGQNRMQVPPWRDLDRYRRNSPLLAADRIRTPLLIAHGDQDFLPLAGSEAMFSALYRQAKDAVLLTYWGEGHYIQSPGNLRDLYARAFAFLDRALAPPGGTAAESHKTP